MLARKKVDFDLVPILLIVAALELALNRLAVPVLRPSSPPVPTWHRDMDLAGLFLFHLSTVLALGVGAWELWELRGRKLFPLATRILLSAVGAAFFGLAAASIIVGPPAALTLQLETCFTLFVLLLALALALRAGDLRLKIGVIVLTVPLLFHFYGTFVVRVLLAGDTVRAGALLDRIRDAGQWSVAVASIIVAICFAPRPLWRSLTRPGPLAIAGFVGTLIAVIMVRHQDVGAEIASRGLGIDLPPGAPPPVIVAFVLAAVAVVWVLSSTLTAGSRARRTLGMGFALVCVGGYSFTWPLTLLTVVAGMLAMVGASGELSRPARERAVPPVDAATWRAYCEALAAEIGATVADEDGATVLRGRHGELPFVVRLAHGAELAIEITFGDVPEAQPALTVAARPERLLGARSHPPPPDTDAPLRRAGDPAFDGRFRMHDADDVGGRVFDDGLRARAAALLDGWIAAWPDAGLRYRVYPGRGAPLDHPLPLGALRAGRPVRPERLVHVFRLLAELAERLC